MAAATVPNNPYVVSDLTDLPDDVITMLYEDPPEYDESQAAKLDDFLRQYEIPESYSFKRADGSTIFLNHWEELRTVLNAEIYLVIDDSGSTRATLKDGRGNNLGTRWDESKAIARPLIELSGILDDDGCTVGFLNRGTVDNVRTWDDVVHMFKDDPAETDLTPLTAVMTELFAHPVKAGKIPLYIIIFDGEPTKVAHGHLHSDVDGFIEALKARDGFVTFMINTDEPEDVAWVDRLDKDDATIETLDDYETERKQVKKTQGMGFAYSKGCHTIRGVLSAFFRKYDLLDEE